MTEPDTSATLNAELQAIKDSWDATTGDGRDTSGTLALADAYVAAHPDEFTDTSIFNDTLQTAVNAIDVFRAAGWEEQLWRVQTWIFHHFDFQNIGGTVEPGIRTPIPAPAS